MSGNDQQHPAEDSKTALSGIRVLDLGRVLAAPFAAQVLGDLGAEVIKVERPDGGDDTRPWKPPEVGGNSAYFASINRNKRSVTLDFSTDEGASAMLMAQAAEKVYRSAGRDCRVDVSVTAGPGAWAEYLPQETILFDGARLNRTTRIDAGEEARVLALAPRRATAPTALAAAVSAGPSTASEATHSV